jgi:phosphoglycolate phosphatase-like HAD superfamily hydrolase
MNKHKKVLAIDFDGTIVDSMPAQERAWSAAAHLISADQNKEQKIIYNLYRGRSGEQMFENISLSNEEKRALRKNKNEIWHSIRNDTPLIAGAKAALKRLSETYTIYIATTADKIYVQSILKREKIENIIKLIITNADVAHPKPSEDMINVIASDANVSKEDIWLIGDSQNDYDLSINSGCNFIFLEAGQTNPSIMTAAQATFKRCQSWSEIEDMLLN